MKKRLELKSKLENISLVEKLIDDISDSVAIPAEVYGKILIATVEAVNNAIVHGNKLILEKNVVIEVHVQETTITIKVTDEGKGFDFTSVPDPTTPENIENISGRGVFLMNKLADRISFKLNGAEIEMKFNI